MSNTTKDELTLAKKMVLVLLNADNKSPVRGKTVFIKQVFLLAKEIIQEIDDNLEFYPFQIGPYSTVLAKLLNEMIRENLIEAETKGGKWIFSITEKGEQIAKDAIELLSENQIQEINRMKRTTSEWGVSGVLRYVYRNYPEYAIDSRVREVILDT
jgi:uncharacterized protein YwgA